MSLVEALPTRRLAGKVILITGAAGAIGLESSKRLLLEGASLSLIDINVEGLAKAVNNLKEWLPSEESLGSRILQIAADVTITDEVDAFVKRTVNTFGRLDCAFLNAGISYASMPIFDTTDESFDRVMNVNVKSGQSMISFYSNAFNFSDLLV
jgi:NAD(P)-dependent dehydrogenase (short-subunit alcohol dehydrogenase family)